MASICSHLGSNRGRPKRFYGPETTTVNTMDTTDICVCWCYASTWGSRRNQSICNRSGATVSRWHHGIVLIHPVSTTCRRNGNFFSSRAWVSIKFSSILAHSFGRLGYCFVASVPKLLSKDTIRNGCSDCPKSVERRSTHAHPNRWAISAGMLLRIVLNYISRVKSVSAHWARAAVIPMTLLDGLGGIFMLLYPKSKWALLFNTLALIGMAQRAVGQALMIEMAIPPWKMITRVTADCQRQKLARVWESTFTAGYCLGTLLGSIVYDFGPYGPQRIENCAAFQLLLFALMLASALSVDSVRAFYFRVLIRSPRAAVTLLPGSATAGVLPTMADGAGAVGLAAGPLAPMIEVMSTACAPEHQRVVNVMEMVQPTGGSGQVTAMAEVLADLHDEYEAWKDHSGGTCAASHHTKTDMPPAPVFTQCEDAAAVVAAAAAGNASELRAGRVVGEPWPVYLVFVSVYVLNLAYMVEWVLYAIIMSTEFGWSATAAGAAQMAGDLVAVVILLVIAHTQGTAADNPTGASCDTTSGADVAMFAGDGRACADRVRCAAGVAWRGARWFVVHLPFNNTLLLLAFAALLVLMAQPTLAVAAVGQIGMGTVYVLGLQVATEMLLVYAHGDAAAGARLMSGSAIAFNLGLFTSALVAYSVYEAYSAQVVLYGAAVAVGAVAVAWVVAFGVRYAALNGGADSPSTRMHNGVGPTWTSWAEVERRALCHYMWEHSEVIGAF
eukprot:m.67182 g.67182  ORF g.67182 m.67182 type:complete len:726 (+) comp15967_c1_seq8:292-2469(+)